MIKKKQERQGNIEIDLTGPDGNVFVLMGYAKSFAKQIWGNEVTKEIEIERGMSEGMDFLYELGDDMEKHLGPKETVAKNMGEYICNRMKESDYENAVNVFDEYFGSFVTLYR